MPSLWFGGWAAFDATIRVAICCNPPTDVPCLHFLDLAGYLVYFNSYRHHIEELQHQLGHNVTEHLS